MISGPAGLQKWDANQENGAKNIFASSNIRVIAARDAFFIRKSFRKLYFFARCLCTSFAVSICMMLVALTEWMITTCIICVGTLHLFINWTCKNRFCVRLNSFTSNGKLR